LTGALPDLPLIVATIEVVPFLIGVTTPAIVTLATVGSVLTHDDTVRPVNAWPAESFGIATAVADTPTVSGELTTTDTVATVAGVGGLVTTTVVPLAFAKVAVTAAVPVEIAVIVPVEPTVTTVSSLDDQTGVPLAAITAPVESFKIAVACVDVPTGIVVASKASATVGAAGWPGAAAAPRIVTAALPTRPSEAPLMLTDPGATAVTIPSPETTARIGLLVLHDTARSSNRLPAESLTTAFARAVLPTCSAPESSVTRTVATLAGSIAEMLIAALAVLPRADAVMTALPAEAAVTRPDDETEATAEFELLQDTVAPLYAWPASSRSEALACVVLPTTRLVALNDTVMLASV
jgi:hypothetical protein